MKRVISDILHTRCITSDITDNEKQAFSQYLHLQRYHPGLDMFSTIDPTHQKNAALPTQYTLTSWEIDASANSLTNHGKYWICGRKKVNLTASIDDLFKFQDEIDIDNILEFKDILDIKEVKEVVKDEQVVKEVKEEVIKEVKEVKEEVKEEVKDIIDITEEVKDEQVKVFVKIIHLLDPIGILRHEYMTPDHPLIPQGEKAWRHTLQKLHSPNNQAYVDAVASYILSRFRELDLTPHCTLSYGSMTGIASSYRYRISDDYSSYRQCRWFWRGIQGHGAKLEILRENEELSVSSDNKALMKEYFICPFDDDKSTIESITELSSDNLPSIDNIEDGTQSLHSFTFDENTHSGGEQTETIKCLNGHLRSRRRENRQDVMNESKSDESKSDESNSDDDSESDDDSKSCDNLEVNLELPSMPVILVYQECQEGTMDDLLDEDEILGHKRGTIKYEKIWLAWIWQIITVLGFLQKSICFTHNDLHTNNIVWRKTDQEYLYYKSRDSTIWRIPTHGRIFSLIDFGRSIFRIGKQLWISDDHWPEHEAGGQYNFGPIYNINEPKIPPNPSFDLSRLAISVIDGLYDEIPKKKKGRMTHPLSKDGSWVVYETVSPLFNLLFSWTIDDNGMTLYQDESGDERYPGFDLYIRIARDIHTAIPREQYTKPVFDMFRFKEPIPINITAYSLGH